MVLGALKDSVEKFADVISKTLDVDVLIIDNLLNIVGKTLRYFDQYYQIRRVSVIGQVIATGQVVVVNDRELSGPCKVCPELKNCDMEGLIGVPISYQGKTVGAIALIMPRVRMAAIFRDVDNSIAFLQNMADLLANKMQTIDDYNAMKLIKHERELLIDSFETAVVSIDMLGYISYYNRSFADTFTYGHDVTGLALSEVVPSAKIQRCIEQQREIHDEYITFENAKNNFCGTMTSKLITDNGLKAGMLWTFCEASVLRTDDTAMVGEKGKISFVRYERYLFPKTLLDTAKRHATTNEPILIQCAENTGEELLAQCIHAFSKRSQKNFLAMDCASCFDIREKVLFGKLGKLHRANHGTLYLRHIECLPISLQNRLADLLRTGRLTHEDNLDLPIDVRLIISGDLKLKERMEKHQFCDELYYRIAENVLVRPPISQNPLILRAILDDALAYYRKYYDRESLPITEGAMQRLCEYRWPENLPEIESAADLLIRGAATQITEDYVIRLMPILCESQAERTLDQVERDQIRELLETYHNKDIVAKKLGIGRATLYRKIKQYDLGGETT